MSLVFLIEIKKAKLIVVEFIDKGIAFSVGFHNLAYATINVTDKDDWEMARKVVGPLL